MSYALIYKNWALRQLPQLFLRGSDFQLLEPVLIIGASFLCSVVNIILCCDDAVSCM